MRFQILGPLGWPVGAVLIPTGTILNYDDGNDWMGQLAKAQGCLPPNCMALDQDAWNMVKGYEPKVRPIPGEGVQV
jgi:hypothetical protein